MAKQARDITKSVLSAADQKEATLRDEIDILESSLQSAIDNNLPDKDQIEAKLKETRKALDKLLEPKHNALGLADDEELGLKHLVRNLKQISRNKTEGLKTLAAGAVTGKLLTADPFITNAWTGMLMARDLFRGSKDQEDPKLGSLSGMDSPSDSPKSIATGDQNLSGISTILASIDYSVRQTFQLLDWVHNYRRFHRREIKIQEKEMKEARQMDLPFADNQMDIPFDNPNVARQATVSNLVGIPDDWAQTIVQQKTELDIPEKKGIVTPEPFDPKPFGEIIVPKLDIINTSLRQGLFGSPPKLDQLKQLTGLENLIDGNEEQLSQAKDMKEALEMLTDLPSIAKQQTDSLEGIKGGIQDLKPSEEFLREQAMLFKRNKTGVGDATQMQIPFKEGGLGAAVKDSLVDTAEVTIGSLLASGLKRVGKWLLTAFAGMGGFGGILPTLTAALNTTAGAIGGGILGLVFSVVDGIKGWFAADNWGTSKFAGVIGGIIGGTGNRGVLSVFANMGKWAGIGAAAGSVIPIGGTLVGGATGAAVGAAIGALTGIIGGERIAKFTDWMGKQISDFWNWLTGWVSSAWSWVTSPFSGKKPPTSTSYGVEGSYNPLESTPNRIGGGIRFNPSNQGMGIQQASVESTILNQPTPALTTVGGRPLVFNTTNAQNNTNITSIRPSTTNSETQKFQHSRYFNSLHGAY